MLASPVVSCPVRSPGWRAPSGLLGRPGGVGVLEVDAVCAWHGGGRYVLSITGRAGVDPAAVEGRSVRLTNGVSQLTPSRLSAVAYAVKAVPTSLWVAILSCSA